MDEYTLLYRYMSWDMVKELLINYARQLPSEQFLRYKQWMYRGVRIWQEKEELCVEFVAFIQKGK